MTAKDLCSISWFCKEGGIMGDVAKYGLNPDCNKGGNFQKHLDTILPRKPLSGYYWMEVPVWGKSGRELKMIPTCPIYEAIQEEVDCTPALSQDAMRADPDTQEWYDIYSWHPGLRRLGRPSAPLLLCLYADGIRFTRSERVGKSDSLLGFFVYTIKTQRRHPIALLKKSEYCKCGCRGWCTIYPIMLAMKWGLEALAKGFRPRLRHDDSEWPSMDPRRGCVDAPLRQGQLIWIKGDLIEQSVTFGLRGLGSGWHPCFFCKTLADNMHAYHTVGLLNDLWGAIDDETDYELYCQRCEVQVLITDETDRLKVCILALFLAPSSSSSPPLASPFPTPSP